MLVVFVVPLGAIVYRAFDDPANFSAALESGVFRRSVWTTVRMSLIVTVVCVILSYPYAYALARSGPGFSAFLLIALMVSFWTSTLVRTYSWKILLNNTGVINKTLISMGIIDEPIRMIGTDFAVGLGVAHVLAPYTILTIYTQIRAVGPELEEAAQVAGARPTVVFWRLIMPMSVPGMAAGAILVFVMALGFYITPAILGSAEDVYIGTAIVQQVQVFLKTGVGAAQSLLLLAIVLLTLGVASRFVSFGKLLGLAKGGVT
ncbi:MAG: ABC transporter permease [Bifidobacteriaceae bacterium]|nr:ABC transporter permease [Bifidobacteriaceae bacterium]